MTHYLNESFLDIDTSISLAAKPLHDGHLGRSSSRRGQQLWSDAADCGLRIGLAHPSWDRLNTFGLLTVARESEAISYR